MTYDELAANQTDETLIKDFKASHYAIYVAGCFGNRDLRINAAFGNELNKRGYEIDDSGDEPIVTKAGVKVQ